MIKLVSNIKQLVVSPGRVPRTIKGGPFQGLKMELDLTCQTQLYLGLFEREVNSRWLKKLSADINTAIDIGVAEGEYTLYLLSKTSAQKVFAFEPSAIDQARLFANLELNGLAHDPRLELSSKFVGSLDSENECTLDSLLPSIEPPCLIKMDVDGSEMNILRGATRLLDLPQIRWIIETHSQQLEEECIQILNQSGFATIIVPNAWWRLFLPEQRPSAHCRWLIAIKNPGTPV